MANGKEYVKISFKYLMKIELGIVGVVGSIIVFIISAIVLAIVYTKSNPFTIDTTYDAIDQYNIGWTFVFKESKIYAINSAGLG